MASNEIKIESKGLKTALLVAGVGAVALAGGALLIYVCVRRRRRSPPSVAVEDKNEHEAAVVNTDPAKEEAPSEAPATRSQVYKYGHCNVHR